MNFPLEHKTVRPGNFVGYNYYHSKRSEQAELINQTRKPLNRTRKLSIVLVGLILIFTAIALKANNTAEKYISIPVSKTTPAVSGTAVATNSCSSNKLSQEILVSLSQRHLWACNYQKILFSSPVVTGDSQYADTVTPAGTYQIYAKETGITLTGSDQISSWNDYVNYWMPFLDNSYGAYGLHDATWRANNEFGNIDPSSSNASHGCVELPLATAKWLYNWVNVGTTVQINS